ncbi:MAG: hypothetical protein HY718_16305 [Planctomycetes bacterium]|nr:hypothetical protein [Planctomycetota bacterium]
MRLRAVPSSRSGWTLRGLVALAGMVVAAIGSSASAARPLGVDVSQFQGTIDWNQVYAGGRVFAFIRATHGSLNDTKFLFNMPAARNAGVLAGAYHFAVPVYDEDYDLPGAHPQTEAARFLNQARNFLIPGYLRPVIDVELGGGQTPVGAANLSDWTNAWIEAVEQQTGVEAIVYCNSNYAKNYLNSTLASRTLWIADWTYPSNPDTAQPTHGTGLWSNWVFWQYSNMGNTAGNPSVPGINARVDLDVFNGTLAQLQNYVIAPTAVISLSPASLSRTVRQFVNPASQTFTVRNTGPGTMVYEVLTAGAWLSVNPDGGTSAGEIDTITVSYSTAGLNVGTHNGTIIVTSLLANNSPQTIEVTMTITPTPGNLDHDGDVDADDLAILLGCITGPGQGPPAAGCAEADLDGDGDTDQSDFGVFQRCLSGTGIPPDPYCAP